MPFTILVVCTGNICRSPAAELLLRARFARAGVDGIDVVSAGTFGLTGHGLDAPTALVLGELGLDTSAHLAQRVRPELVTAADLVLTAGSEHRSTLVQAEPLAFRKTFTMREFARLGAAMPVLDGATGDDLRGRVREVASQRGWVEAGAPGSDEIADPYGGGVDVARKTVAVLVETVDQIAQALGVATAPVN